MCCHDKHEKACVIAKALKSTARTQLRSCKFVNRRRTLNISTPFRNTILTFRIFRIPIIQILIHRSPMSNYIEKVISVIIMYITLHQYIPIESNLKQFRDHLGQCRDIKILLILFLRNTKGETKTTATTIKHEPDPC